MYVSMYVYTIGRQGCIFFRAFVGFRGKKMNKKEIRGGEEKRGKREGKKGKMEEKRGKREGKRGKGLEGRKRGKGKNYEKPEFKKSFIILLKSKIFFLVY